MTTLAKDPRLQVAVEHQDPYVAAGISALPRSLVSVTLLLVWLGFFGQLILYGAALNVVLDRRRHGGPILPQPPSPPDP